MKKVDIIRLYFRSWIEQNRNNYDEIFEENAIYIECYGPEYHGLIQIKKWFDDWNKNGKVPEWSIKQIIAEDNIAVVEWYFECSYNNEISGFNGCSIVEFSNSNRIKSLKEFQSKAEHDYPYGK